MAKITVDPSHDFLEQDPHPIHPFFYPKSIAVIGATNTPNSVGNTLMHNLDVSEFPGPLYPINPKYAELFNRKCYPSIDAINEPIDLVVIITPAKTVPNLIDQCARKDVKGVIIISAGFKELGPEGLKLENEVLKRAKKGNIRIVGPNCLGIMNPSAHFNATFASSMAHQGNIAFISQSGAMCTAVLDWSLKQKIGFSAFVSIGSMADVNWGDLIDYLGSDPNTHSILIYMETIGDADSFLSAAREVAINKPIIVIKAGRTEEAAQAAASHTGSLAGSDDVFDAAMRRVGVLRVDKIGELFDMAEVLAKQPTPKGPNLVILTNAGGPAVLATDAAAQYGAKMAQLTDETIEELNAFLPEAWSHSNPVDLLGDAGPDRYTKAIEILSKDPNIDGILVILSPQDMTDITGTAKCLIPYSGASDKPLLASWMGGEEVEKGVEILTQSNIPTFDYPDDASKTFAAMWRQYFALQGLYQTPEIREDLSKVQERTENCEAIIQKALSEGRELLTEEESKRVLKTYSIPIVETVIATTKEEAAKAADQIGYPSVLKLHSETITHKTDVGGVLLNLPDAQSVMDGFDAIFHSVKEKAGEEHFLGVTVQKMIQLDGYELILGSTIDPQFGPTLLFGTGGQLVEIYKDSSLGLPPLNSVLARRLMQQTKIFEALEGVRGRKSVDLDKLESILIAFSELIVSHPHIAECDINPLLASENELIALDARIVLSKEPVAKPVIRPYPNQYISKGKLQDGTSVEIRPVRPEDEPKLKTFHQELSQATVKARYFRTLSLEERVSHERMIRICHTDYKREIPLLAFSNEVVIGVFRLSKTATPTVAIGKLIIADRMQKKGLGTLLLNKALEIAKEEQIKELRLQILSENEAMKKMLTDAGFKLQKSSKNEQIINATLEI